MLIIEVIGNIITHWYVGELLQLQGKSRGAGRMNHPNLKELEQQAADLMERNPEFNPQLEQRLIGIYKSMLRQMNRQDSLYQPIKEKVIDQLIRYGTYMKSAEEKNFQAAEAALGQVLRYDRKNPIAAYRLGFIAYRNEQYSSALIHFENAVKYHQRHANHKYRLTEQQEKNAYLYLTNSSLHIAKSTYEKMNEAFSYLPKKLSSYKFSELYSYLDENEQYMESRSMRRILYDVQHADKRRSRLMLV